MPATAHPPLEEYLETIAFLVEEGSPVIQTRIAARMKKTPAAVSEIIIRLEADGYLIRHDRQIELTERGEAIARTVIRRHRLAERVLVDIIGIRWAAAHHEAGRWEHVISDQVEERLVAILGDPATDPYGNPIPGSSHHAPRRSELISLDDARPGQQVRLERVTEDIEDEQALLEHLEHAGFVPGVTATVLRQLLGDTVTLQIDDSEVTFGAMLTKRLLVVAVTEPLLAAAASDAS